MNSELSLLAEKTVRLLRERKITLATAESCTGGMLSELITSVPGASEVFELGIVSYSSRIKNKILSVQRKTLEKYGAVSRQTAVEMASNVLSVSDADIGVSVTGVAGPASSEGKLPGTVYIALAGKTSARAEKLCFEPESRTFVRESAAAAVLELIIKYIEG